MSQLFGLAQRFAQIQSKINTLDTELSQIITEEIPFVKNNLSTKLTPAFRKAIESNLLDNRDTIISIWQQIQLAKLEAEKLNV